MFNGYNDSALISYEFNQEREKKSENVSKYSYGHDGGVQSTLTHPNNRQSEFWSGKPNFIGIPNVVKCNCTGCYPTTDNQSYQVESTRHRPWLPKTFSVPLNGSNECKLPAYQWDSTLNQICYSDPNIPYGQENGGKQSYYRQFQTPNQPGVIISANKQKSEMGFQNGVRQPVMCNPGYDLTKRVNGRSYYDGDKYSVGAYSMNQIPRLPVEPYTKAVPSNLNQNRVPSTGHRKENSPQYDHYSSTKIFPENYHPGLSPMDLKNTGIQMDYSYFNRDPDFFRNNYTEMKRNNLAIQNRKDCAVTQASLEQHYGRSKHPENLKGCDMFYPNLEKNQMENCVQRIENDGMNRISRSMMVCNDLRYADERPQVFPYQNNAACRNYVRPEYPQFNSQCIPELQETDKNQFRTSSQQLQSCDQHPQGNNSCIVDCPKDSSDKTQSYGRTQLVDAQGKPSFLETIRSEELTKNGTSKISPLRLLRKKKFVTAPQELSSVTNIMEAPTLDVRKFWSTWAEEEDENVSPTQMVVLDCQNIDPEQAKLLNFYETDPSRPINLENVILKNPDCVKDSSENVKESEQPVDDQEKQVEIPTQIEPMIKNTNEVIPELESVNISPKKYRSHEHRKKKMEDVMDKWTEKKFDFLKRSEESKAAEMIRYEEEKKKIFERRLSFQQIGANRIENSQEDMQGSFEENSQSNSPKERTTSDLPTSEYRRNKFLDYSEVIVNCCKDIQKMENKEGNQSTEAIAVKKEEPDVKDEAKSPLEMDDILKKMSEINFQEMRSENGLEASKKAKKTKKKKLDQSETDARTDLKVETVSKPTIKFSIQKSHDLKISFKVLNKKYDEEVQREETKPIEDINTELITLKYKSIQNGGKLSDSKKKTGKLRRKKHAPVLKIKKSRYIEEERDPLAEDDEAKTYPSDGFQVQETVDSAKIKLTFKRHKANLETAYKIENEGLDVGCEEHENTSEVIENRHRKKSKKAKKHKTFTQEDIVSSKLEPKSTELHSSADDGSESIYMNRLESTSKEHSGNSSVSHHLCSIHEEETHENPTTPFEMTLPEKRLCELTVQNDVMEDSKCEIDGEEQVDLIVNCDETGVLNDEQDKFSPDEDIGEAISKAFEDENTKEKIQEISLDFIRSINSPDIETIRQTEKTEEIEARDATEKRNKNGGVVIESTNVNHSILESSYEVKKNSDFLETKTDSGSISLAETDAGLESYSEKNVSTGIAGIDAVGKSVTENLTGSGSIYSPETNLEEQINSKPVQDNSEDYDSLKEKTEDFERGFEENVESEIPKVVDNKPTTEFEGILQKIVDSERSESRLECPEEDTENEPDVIRNSEPVHLVFDKVSDKEHGFSEMKPDSALPPNEEMHQSTMGAASTTSLIDRNQIDKGPEPDQAVIKEGDLNVENFCRSQSNQNFGNENKIDSESQSIDLLKYENEEVKTSVEDQSRVCYFNDKEEKTFIIESELNNCAIYEKEDKLYESDAVKVHDNTVPCVRPTNHVENEKNNADTTSNSKSDASDNEHIRDHDSFTEQAELQNTDFCSHVVHKNCDENEIEQERVEFENLIQRPEIINVENISHNSDIDHLIYGSGNINEGSVNGTEETVIPDSQNPPPSNEPSTPVTSPSQPVEFDEDEESRNNEAYEKIETRVEIDLLPSDNQKSSRVESKNYSELEEGEAQPKDLPETGNSRCVTVESAQCSIIPTTHNHEPDDFTPCENTKAADTGDENKSEFDNHFECDKENQMQMIHLEKPDEEDKASDMVFINDKMTSFLEPPRNTTVIDNKDDPDSTASASAVDHSRVNTPSTDPTGNTLKNHVDLERSSSPQPNEREFSSLELFSNQESELEDGEIVDSSSDASEPTEPIAMSDVHKTIEFKIQKPNRRHSIYFHKSESQPSSSLCEGRFIKSKSCPPTLSVTSLAFQFNISVKDIPLPVGPPPLDSCFNFDKTVKKAKESEEAKEKLEQVSIGRVLEIKGKETVQDLPSGSPFGAIELQNCRNPSPPRSDALGAHRSKIKFSLAKRSRLSKVGLPSGKPKVLEKPEFFGNSNAVVTVQTGDPEPEVTKTVKEPEPDIIKTGEKSELRFNETTENTDVRSVELVKKSDLETNELEIIQKEIFEPVEETTMKLNEPIGKLETEDVESFEKSEPETVKLSEIVEPEAIDPVENLEVEVVEQSINIINETETETDTNKIRTPDYVSEAIEEISECQIVLVPNSSPTQADDKDHQKSDLEVESLCEDANVEVVNVMGDFMRDEFYEDIPTSEDLPNGDSVDEKVNDDKFRNIMQNCLENAKKFLNVGNLKLFSCSVDDLFELDNQENESAANHISRDVLLTSCEDTNDDLGLNEKFQPVDISMEFVPSDVCPEILPVDNWPYLEEEVPSSPLKSSEADLILENTITEVVPNRKRAAKESENYKRFRRKSLVDDDDDDAEMLRSKIAAHRRKTIDGFNSFLSYTKLNGIDKPNESLKCRLSLEKLNKNGVEFISPQDDFPKKTQDLQTNEKLNYKSPLWQPKVMLIRISENEVTRFKKTKIHSRSAENIDIPAVKKQKSDHTDNKCVENEVILSIPPVDSIKGLITTSPDIKRHKPRFRNLHSKRKPEQEQSQPKAIETALSELFKDSDEESKNMKYEKGNKNVKIPESKQKTDSKTDRHSSRYHSHKDKHDHRDRRRESEKDHHRHKEKHKHERSKHDGKRHRSNHSDDDRKRSHSKINGGHEEASPKHAWTCEVCGFNDASERVAHIKNHPFHCQSCHLAFKTEAYFTNHLTEMHKDIRNQHHCLLCELSFDTEEEYQRHLETREHTHLEAVEKNTINTLFTLLTGSPCPVLGLVEMKPEWLPNQPGTVHFYHQATPLSLALQYLKMHRDLTSYSEVSKVHPN